MIRLILLNACLATITALFAFVASRLLRNAALIHLVWVVVLLRFLAPPMIDMRIPVAPRPPLAKTPVAPERPATAPTIAHKAGTRRSDRAESVEHHPTWGPWLTIVWGSGSMLTLLTIGWRAHRFQRLIRRTGRRDPHLDQLVQTISSEMSVRAVPRARLVNARVSPLVWAWCQRPLLIVPAQLWAAMSDVERIAVIRHELAHLIRRDHWVRVVEALATITHWWCPVLWWVRRSLHAYEERCCDGWAASWGPEARAALARACLQTVHFLGHAQGDPLQFGATSMAGFPTLRRRIHFILEGEPMQTKLRWNLAAMFLFGIVLSISPSWGNDEIEKTKSPNDAVTRVDPFEALAVQGEVDVTLQTGERYSVNFAEDDEHRPRTKFDAKNKTLWIVSDSDQAERGRVLVTVPRLPAIEAQDNVALRVPKVDSSSVRISLVNHSQMEIDGHCDALTVAIDDSSHLSGRELFANLALVQARRHSIIELGKVKSLIVKNDETSRVEIGNGTNAVKIHTDDR